MATLVLTAVGTVVGGPIGGAIGALIGQQIDQRIFAPAPRQGPRLSDLAVQSSRYGTAIPALFGAVRVAGTVIWGTNLKETHKLVSNGKGRPKTDTYSYSSSFAVALSCRPIARIGRIWADGKLLRGAAGDFKTETGFRVYTGGVGQAVDPLIAAAEGIVRTPAYRGLAYAVFEDMALAAYGNRIPSLSFEVIADEGGLSAGAVLSGFNTAGLVAAGGPMLGGLAAQGASVRAVGEGLAQIAPFSLIDGNGVLTARFDPAAARTVLDSDLGASASTRGGERVTISRAAAATLPVRMSLTYLDTARDYQAGLQRARREGAGRTEEAIDLPVTLSADAAKALADVRLKRRWAERSSATITVPWRNLDIRAGDTLTVPGAVGRWRVARVHFEAMTLRLELIGMADGSVTAASADAGRTVAQLDQVHGATTVAVIDLPQLSDALETGPYLAVAAAGVSPGWRRAALLASTDGGASYSAIGGTGFPATIGTTVSALPAASTALIDRVNTVDVALLNSAMSLNDADDAALIAGANRAMIGDEMIQFGRAQPLGGGVWRLSTLWRGRRGTEWASVSRAAGARFVLIDTTTFARVPSAQAIGGVLIMATGVGDPSGVTAVAPAIVGAAARPLSPANLHSVTNAGGDLIIDWVRRSRTGWRWDDGVDAPIAEEREAYRITKSVSGRSDLTVEVATPVWTYSAAERAADRAAGATVAQISVVQVGTNGTSRSALIIVSP